jgi:hypothetical protein
LSTQHFSSFLLNESDFVIILLFCSNFFFFFFLNPFQIKTTDKEELRECVPPTSLPPRSTYRKSSGDEIELRAPDSNDRKPKLRGMGGGKKFDAIRQICARMTADFID